MAGAVQELLRPSRAGVVPADLCAGGVQRQRAEVDASDAGAGDRAGSVPSVSAFHHACALGRRGRLATAARRRAGTSRCVDSRQYELSETGTALGRRCAAVLRGARQDRQLPSRGDGGAVDGCARVVSRRGAVRARGMADSGAAHAGADTGRRRLRIEVASGPSVGAPAPSRGLDADGRDRGCRIRRCDDVPGRAASPPIALCAGHLVASDGIHHAPARAATGGQSSRSASDPVAHGHRAQASGGASADGAGASNRVAPRHVAQWNAAAADGTFRGRPGHPRARVAARATGARGLVAVRGRDRREDTAQVPTSSHSPPPRRWAPWCDWRISAGRSSSSTRS